MALNWESGKRVAITKKLAERFATMEAAQGDCKLDQSLLDYLVRECNRLEFDNPSWAAIYCKATRRWYRVDGKHTSTIFHEGLAPIDGRHAMVLEGIADTLVDVATAYKQFNAPESARSGSDMNGAYTATHKTLGRLPGWFIDQLARSLEMARIILDGAKTRTSKSEQAEAVLGEEEFALAAYDIFNPPGLVKEVTALLSKKPVVCFMYTSWREIGGSPAKLGLWKDFWYIARGDGVHDSSNPAVVLQKWLNHHTLGVSSGSSKRGVSRMQMYQKCSDQFDAFVKLHTDGAPAKTEHPKYKARGRRKARA